MNKSKTILIIATLDTKGSEAFFVKNLIEERGIRTLVMDSGIMGDACFNADIPASKVAEAASCTLPELVSMKDESKAMAEMAKGAEIIVTELFEKGEFDGIIALGGTMGTALALKVFRKLPIGITKVLAELCGGYCCSPGRMEAASKMGIPQIVAPGGIGIFPLGSLENIPERFRGRLAKAHNEIASAIRASEEEMAETAKVMASKLNRSTGPVVVVIPEKGFFEYDRPGEFFFYPEGRKIFIETMRDTLRPEIECVIMDRHINDPEFAEKVSNIALHLFKRDHA